MALPSITSRRVVPYVLGGASGIHVLVRMWRLSRLPASSTPLHFFLLKHSDIILVLGSSPIVIWHIAKHHHQHSSHSDPHPAQPSSSWLPQIAHELRQVFTALLLGLGLIKRKASAGKTPQIGRLVSQLKGVVYQGVEAVNKLDPPDTLNGRELAREA